MGKNSMLKGLDAFGKVSQRAKRERTSEPARPQDVLESDAWGCSTSDTHRPWKTSRSRLALEAYVRKPFLLLAADVSAA